MTLRFKAALAAASLIALAAGAATAQDTLVIGYQTTIDPSKVPQADGLYEQAIPATIEWRKFDSGADVITAVASGDVQIGYVGSSPLAAAASQQLPIRTIWIAALLGDAEALVVRDGSGIETPEDLVGKTVAVPFVSTTHYSLLAALAHWGIDPTTVNIVNLRPPEITAAWARGDIDAAYVWEPALGQTKETGSVLISSKDVAAWGAPTYDAWIARTDLIEEHPEYVQGFVDVTAAAVDAYLADPAAWDAASAEAQKIAELSGAKPEDVAVLLAGSGYPNAAEQAGADYLGGATAQSIATTSQFLVDQGRIDAALDDYSPYVDASFAAAVPANP